MQSGWEPPATPALWGRLPEEEHHEHHQEGSYNPGYQQPPQQRMSSRPLLLSIALMMTYLSSLRPREAALRPDAAVAGAHPRGGAQDRLGRPQRRAQEADRGAHTARTCSGWRLCSSLHVRSAAVFLPGLAYSARDTLHTKNMRRAMMRCVVVPCPTLSHLGSSC